MWRDFPEENSLESSGKKSNSCGKKSNISGKMNLEVLPVSAVSATAKTTKRHLASSSSSAVTITPIFRPLLAGASKRKSATPTRTAAPAAVQMEPVDLSVRHDSSDDDKTEEEKVGFATIHDWLDCVTIDSRADMTNHFS